MNKDGVNLYKGMALDEAVSHRIHSGIFEIMGYLSIIDKSELSNEDRSYLSSAEELCSMVISDLHEIIDNYRAKW